MKILDGIEHFSLIRKYNHNNITYDYALFDNQQGDVFFAIKGKDYVCSQPEYAQFSVFLYAVSTKIEEDISYPMEHIRTFIEGYLREEKLKRIFEECNQLTSLEGIENLTNLQELCCRNNQLTYDRENKLKRIFNEDNSGNQVEMEIP